VRFPRLILPLGQIRADFAIPQTSVNKTAHCNGVAPNACQNRQMLEFLFELLLEGIFEFLAEGLFEGICYYTGRLTALLVHLSNRTLSIFFTSKNEGDFFLSGDGYCLGLAIWIVIGLTSLGSWAYSHHRPLHPHVRVRAFGKELFNSRKGSALLNTSNALPII
jgi:hypothetical protein